MTAVSAGLHRLTVAALAAVTVLAAAVPAAQADTGCTSAGSSSVTVTCPVGLADTWTVPAGVTQATFDVQGAQGGQSGGLGGHAKATLAVTPFDQYAIEVGSAGAGGADPVGGTPGGGRGGALCIPPLFGGPPTCFFGGGGGGASIVSLGDPSAVANWQLVAGGGGGSLGGGDGGGLTGGGGSGGLGGDQTGTSGSGDHLNGGRGFSSFGVAYGGGGGGGYYGGQGSDSGGGGGGSGFAPDPADFLPATKTGDGLVTITYAGSLDLSPDPLAFAPVVLGSTSGVNTVTVKNLTSADLSIDGLSVGGADAAAFSIAGSGSCGSPSAASPKVLAAGASCTVDITFTPTAVGDYSAFLQVTPTQVGTPPATSDLSATGVAVAPTESIHSPTMDGSIYVSGSVPDSSFSCTTGNGGTLKDGVDGCSGSIDDGAAIASGTPLATSVGSHKLVVTAMQTDGQHTSLTYNYTVIRLVPLVSTTDASGITATAATLNGAIVPPGAATTYQFEYGTATSYGSTTSVQSLPAGTDPVSVSGALTGLTPNVTYHYRLDATANGTTVQGNDRMFTTAPLAPVATTAAATSVTTNRATLNATINPEGVAASYHFEFHTSGGTILSTPTVALAAGSSAVPVAVVLTGLNPSTAYTFKIVATNAGGTGSGTDLGFTTLAPGVGAPVVVTSPATAMTTTGATLNGTIDTSGPGASYHFEYHPTAGGPTVSTSTVTLGAGLGAQPVSAFVTGLTPGTQYLYDLVATTPGGTGTGSDVPFTTLTAPSLSLSTTASATITLGTTATLRDSAIVGGRTNPVSGATITFRLYGPDDNSCTGRVLATSTISYPAAGGAVSSTAYLPTRAGTYRWVASYSGDLHNAAITGHCNDAGESTIVNKATPRITQFSSGGTSLGGSLTDYATVSNRVNPTTPANVVFRVFGPNDTTCSQPAAFTSTIAYPTYGGPVTSANFAPATIGAYRWTATYSGDANNNAATTACSAAVNVTRSAFFSSLTLVGQNASLAWLY